MFAIHLSARYLSAALLLIFGLALTGTRNYSSEIEKLRFSMSCKVLRV